MTHHDDPVSNDCQDCCDILPALAQVLVALNPNPTMAQVSGAVGKVGITALWQAVVDGANVNAAVLANNSYAYTDATGTVVAALPVLGSMDQTAINNKPGWSALKLACSVPLNYNKGNALAELINLPQIVATANTDGSVSYSFGNTRVFANIYNLLAQHIKALKGTTAAIGNYNNAATNADIGIPVADLCDVSKWPAFDNGVNGDIPDRDLYTAVRQSTHDAGASATSAPTAAEWKTAILAAGGVVPTTFVRADETTLSNLLTNGAPPVTNTLSGHFQMAAHKKYKALCKSPSVACSKDAVEPWQHVLAGADSDYSDIPKSYSVNPSTISAFLGSATGSVGNWTSQIASIISNANLNLAALSNKYLVYKVLNDMGYTTAAQLDSTTGVYSSVVSSASNATDFDVFNNSYIAGQSVTNRLALLKSGPNKSTKPYSYTPMAASPILLKGDDKLAEVVSALQTAPNGIKQFTGVATTPLVAKMGVRLDADDLNDLGTLSYVINSLTNSIADRSNLGKSGFGAVKYTYADALPESGDNFLQQFINAYSIDKNGDPVANVTASAFADLTGSTLSLTDKNVSDILDSLVGMDKLKELLVKVRIASKNAIANGSTTNAFTAATFLKNLLKWVDKQPSLTLNDVMSLPASKIFDNKTPLAAAVLGATAITVGGTVNPPSFDLTKRVAKYAASSPAALTKVQQLVEDLSDAATGSFVMNALACKSQGFDLQPAFGSTSANRVNALYQGLARDNVFAVSSYRMAFDKEDPQVVADQLVSGGPSGSDATYPVLADYGTTTSLPTQTVAPANQKAANVWYYAYNDESGLQFMKQYITSLNPAVTLTWLQDVKTYNAKTGTIYTAGISGASGSTQKFRVLPAILAKVFPNANMANLFDEAGYDALEQL